MIEFLITSFINAALKLLAGWLTWMFAMWLQVPEWAALTMVIMGVQSTYFNYNSQ